jgi:hypothetical protein
VAPFIANIEVHTSTQQEQTKIFTRRKAKRGEGRKIVVEIWKGVTASEGATVVK